MGEGVLQGRHQDAETKRGPGSGLRGGSIPQLAAGGADEWFEAAAPALKGGHGMDPTKVSKPEANEFQPIDEVDGLSQEQLDSISLQGQEEAPLTAQQIANGERCRWGDEWAAGEIWCEPDWIEFEANEDPLPISVPEFRWALMTFPAGTGLGWDGIHPRALDRLDDATIQALIDLVIACEKLGRWPTIIEMVVVVVLPKPDGDWQSIRLLLFLPRIWMRIRRPVTLQWERVQSRPYLYAGEAKGATVAAWKQAARGERAQLWGTSCDQGLLDLAKAFERIQNKPSRAASGQAGIPHVDDPAFHCDLSHAEGPQDWQCGIGSGGGYQGDHSRVRDSRHRNETRND